MTCPRTKASKDRSQTTKKDPAKYGPAKLKDDAIGYLSTIIEKYPESKFKNDAEKTLTVLKK
ncbi:MAG: outer membrane protein assembly factor BamD [Acidobacteria bacterium]|nr:outer membrane protein assembly factor BamD [Acidobacteriota bacterium]